MEFKLSDKGEKFIKRWENLELTIYSDYAGHATIGWGHKIVGADILAQGITIGHTITEGQAEVLFKEDIDHVENFLNNNFGFNPDQTKIDALIAFIFNIGERNFLNSHVYSFLKYLDLEHAQEYWAKWCHAMNPETHQKEVVQGLVNRRNAEVKLFRDGVYE